MMKMFATITAATIALAGTAFAQVTTQVAVLGASGEAVYSLQVQGANGVIYNCKPELVTMDGNTGRLCVRADGGGLFAAGAGLGTGAAAAGAALVLLAVASGSSSTTTTTTTN